jgi:hypothetical protein
MDEGLMAFDIAESLSPIMITPAREKSTSIQSTDVALM